MKRKRMEPIIAVIDEAAIIVAAAIIAVYGGYRAGLLSAEEALVALLLVLAVVAPLVWKLASIQAEREKVGPEALIGSLGVAIEDLDPEGYVEVEGELWRARALDPPITRGSRVRVVSLSGLTLIVEKAEGGRSDVRL